ncbi:MAG: hypothetical protein AB8G99_24525 [Planctomycetaceae bacterium]
MNPNAAGPGRFIGAVFGLGFLGIGVTVLGYLWLTPFNQFGSPPLFFRIFGSFIAIMFVAMGGGTAYAAITGKANPVGNHRQISDVIQHASSEQGKSEPSTGDNYACDSCGAPLNSETDVSPHGDAKCTHCGRWFNIHGK